MKMAQSIEEYFENNSEQIDILEKLRSILVKTELTETLKWGMPTYTINGKNVIGIGAFKSYAGIWFFQGVFLKDESRKLINAQEEKTRGMRQWRFDDINAIDENLLLSYIQEAIQNQKDGKEIKPEKKPLVIPDELKEALASNAELSEIFDELTLTNKRGYAEYIANAKRLETKIKRIEKIIPMIQEGIGLNDKYK